MTPRCGSCSTPTTSAWSTRSRRCCPACGRAQIRPHHQHLVDDRVWWPTRPTPTTRRRSSRSKRSPRRWPRRSGPLGIKVSAVEPGAFRTDWAARSMQESSTPIGDYDENVGTRKTMIKEFANHLPGDPAQGRRGGADADHARRAAAAAAARPRRAEGGARQDRLRCRRRSRSGKPSPRTCNFPNRNG